MSPYRVDARMAGRHPFELFTIYLAIVTSIPTVLGIVPQPGTLRTVMPPWMSAGWAWTLLVGSLLTLVGIYWKDRILGLIGEQLGLALVGVASVAYAICVVYVAGADAVITASLIGGFGASCLRRYFQIQQTLNAVHEAERRRHHPDDEENSP